MPLCETKKVRARSDILATANTMIARKGYASTTMREIADAANVSHQTLGNYFPSKAKIVHTMLTDVDRIDGRRAAIIAVSDSLLAKLHSVAKHYWTRSPITSAH